MKPEPSTEEEPLSTRDRVWKEIFAKHPTDKARMDAWLQTDLIPMIGKAEWAAMHAGKCGVCGSSSGRLYPGGWRCDDHKLGRTNQKERS